MDTPFVQLRFRMLLAEPLPQETNANETSTEEKEGGGFGDDGLEGLGRARLS